MTNPHSDQAAGGEERLMNEPLLIHGDDGSWLLADSEEQAREWIAEYEPDYKVIRDAGWMCDVGWNAYELAEQKRINEFDAQVPIRELREQVERLEAERDRYKAALEDAIEFADQGWSYASPYFIEKWDYAGHRAKLVTALAQIAEEN